MEILPEDFAQRFPLLASQLSHDKVLMLSDTLEVEELAEGQTVIQQGGESDALLFVWDGALDIVIASAEGPRRIATVTSGSVLGEVSLLMPGPATATVIAAQPATILKLSRVRFEDLCAFDLDVASSLLNQLLHSLAERLRSATDRLYDLSTALYGPTQE